MNEDLMRKLAPVPRLAPLMPPLDPRAELALLCRVLFAAGYDDHIAGHITLKQPDGTILCNPWELAWDELKASDVITLDDSGKVIAGHWNVTPAINLHLEIHARRPDVQVVIHNHSRYGTIWANARRVPPVYDQTSAQVDGEVVLIDEYQTTVNDRTEGANCARALGNAKWALLANHGVLIVARDVRQAHLRAVTLEWRCRQAWMVAAIGGGEHLAESVANRVGAMIDGAGFPFLWEAMVRRELRRDPDVSQ
jgi:ribulose-5-phosphate 4-epimerase/fuculose-1-phosphate aldolase